MSDDVKPGSFDPDFGFVIADGPAICVMCGRDESERPILLTDDIGITSTSSPVSPCGVCEPCSYLAAWRWRRLDDGVVVNPFPAAPKVVMVLIARERTITALSTMPARDSEAGVERPVTMPDPVAPHEFLMVTRKEEPSAFALPGGKVEQGEDPRDAAVRELLEETGVRAWPAALDVVYQGFTARGKLATVYLCRVYSGEPVKREEGVAVAWKAGSLVDHSGYYKGFYFGVDAAFKTRLDVQRFSGMSVKLCTRMGKVATSYIDLFDEVYDGSATSTNEDLQLLSSYKLAMREDEKMALDLVCKKTAASAKPAPVLADSVSLTDLDDDDDKLEDDVE